MIPHSWIIECLDLFGVADNIESLLVNSMEKWKLMLCSESSELGEKPYNYPMCFLNT